MSKVESDNSSSTIYSTPADGENFFTQDALLSQENMIAGAGLGLHSIYNKDTFQEAKTSVPHDDATEIKNETSLLQTFFSWFKQPKENEKSPSSPSSTIENLTIASQETINPTPSLEPPSHIPDQFLQMTFPPFSRSNELKTLPPTSSLEQTLAFMQDKTMDSIMFLIFKFQINLEKEHANVAEKTYSKYLEFHESQQKLLMEIKDLLINDEVISKKFQVAQNAASIASLVATALSFGLLGPLAGFLTTAAAAGLSVTTESASAYFKSAMDEHKALCETYHHKHQYYQDRSEDSHERLLTTAEADKVFKERWIKFLKRLDIMRKLVLKK